MYSGSIDIGKGLYVWISLVINRTSVRIKQSV
jgi:hypothetical protein